MKKLFKISFTCLLLLTAVQVMAQEDLDKKNRKRYENFKERNISKSYPASGNNLNIDSRFGEVKITTWDKNEIKIDIHIEASSNQKEMADKTFEKLDVKDSQEGKDINLKTVIEDININCKNCSNTMSVDYDIHIPASNKLSIENSFGSIEIPDYTGPVILKSSYGYLKAGKLSHPEMITVEFGKAVIKSLSNTNMVFKYSGIFIEELTGTNRMKMEFCSYSRVNVDNDLRYLNISESYSTLHIQPSINISVNYDISTSYGSFTDKSNANIKRTDKPNEYGPDFDQHYEGKAGSGTAKIEIKSSFGSILVGGTEGDMNTMKSNKEKNKDKNKRVI